MKQKKLAILVVAMMLVCILSIFQLVACDQKKDDGNVTVKDEYQEVELTTSNFFDYFIPNTTSTYIRSYKFLSSSSIYVYEYKVDYSVKCKYSKAISNNVTISFKVDTESYYDSNKELQSSDVIKTMYLTDAGSGELSYNYDEYVISGMGGPGGGLVLNEYRLAEVTGTIKVPKN